jgi:hypothetical protein
LKSEHDLVRKPVPTFRDHALTHSVAQALDAFFLGAVVTAIERAVLFQAVADDADAAMIAGRRQRMDGAFEAVDVRALPFIVT